MCGRFTLRTPVLAVADLFDLPTNGVERAVLEQARFNIAPTQQIAAVLQSTEHGNRELAWLRWGLVGPRAGDPKSGAPLINARAETVATKPAFREAFRARRCLVPADGFFEWKRHGRARQSYYIRMMDDRPFAFAGLWQRYRHGDATIESCAIITTEANELLRGLHDRMPVILDRQQFDCWLDPAIHDPQALLPLLTSYPAERMTAFAVSTAVNSARLDSPRCIEPAAPAPVQGTLFD
jgi:putative SOS response-associated peptidase YedK